MQIYTETERLILREIVEEDAEGMFLMNSDPEVMKYLGKVTNSQIADAVNDIHAIRRQYIDNGIGRWAMEEKSSGRFIGWTGLKLVREPTNGHTGFYDLGYRMIRAFWGKGFATESARAALIYGFNVLKPDTIYGRAETGNHASLHVLKKCGLAYIETFEHDGVPHEWLSLSAKDWQQKQKS